jgi:hypothetical protein
VAQCGLPLGTVCGSVGLLFAPTAVWMRWWGVWLVLVAGLASGMIASFFVGQALWNRQCRGR